MLKRLTLIFVLLFAVFAGAAFATEVPTVNLPVELREQNWTDPVTREGSCVFATQVMSLRWMLQDTEANYFQNNFSGGEWADDSWHYGDNLARKLDARQIPYAFSLDGDESILNWALSTRRPVGVTTHGGRHMQLLVHFDDQWAALIDNNNPSVVNWVPREKFLAEWRASNSWAIVIVESPCPPLPVKGSK